MNKIALTEKEMLSAMKKELLTNVIPLFEKQSERMDEFQIQMERFNGQLENQIFLNSSQATSLKKTVERRVRELLENDEDYKDKSRKMFSAIWSGLKDIHQVPSYREIPRTHYQSSIVFINKWEPLYR